MSNSREGIVDKIVRKYNLTKGQDEGFRSMIAWLNGSEKEFSLSGKPGTGKSYLLRLVVDYFEEVNKLKEKSLLDVFSIGGGQNAILGLTVSHKAKNVLKESVPNAHTIASGLGMKTKFKDNGEIEFVVPDRFYTPPPITEADLIIVDESSMISRYVREQILKHARSTAKIIYSGDPRQLPAIDSSRKINEDSVVFTVPNKYELTEPIRQKEGNPILELAYQIAEHIDSDWTLSFLNDIKTNYNQETQTGVFTTNRTRAVQSLIAYVKSMYDKGEESKINTFYIAYRNKAVKEINEIVRTAIFPDITDRFHKRDRIVAMDNFYKKVDRGIETLMFNSEVYIVDGYKIGMHKMVKVYWLDVRGIKEEIPVIHAEGEIMFKRQKKALRDEAKRDRKQWPKFYAFSDSFAKVDYAYAINSHRSQGSTFDSAYIDVSDISAVGPISNKEKLQSIYVAVTRPSHRVALF